MKFTPPALSSTTFTLLLLAVQFCICGCTALNPVVKSDYDPDVIFQSYRTFAWHPTEVASISPINNPVYNPIVDEHVKNAIESQLVKKNITPTTTNNPDLIIAYDISIDPATAPTGPNIAPDYGYGYWYGYRYNYDHAGVPAYRDIRDYVIGTLVIDFIDPSSNELVWRGWTAGRLDPSTLDISKINRAAARVISKFPPASPLR